MVQYRCAVQYEGILFPGIVTELDANYYSIGDSVSFTCGLGVGDDGAVPHATEWCASSVFLLLSNISY